MSSRPREDLLAQIDSSLEQYLALVDQYQKQRETFTSQFSKGFVSLAQANFSPNHRMRYGQDFYDERMQAIRKVKCEGMSTMRIVKSGPSETENTGRDKACSERTPTGDSDKESASNEQNKDPIKWFGILVPQCLRAAQAHFSTSLDTSVADLVHVTAEMRRHEHEISRLRKDLRRMDAS